MPVLITSPMVGGLGRRVSGRVVVAATGEFPQGGDHVTTAVQAGVVRDGLFYGLDGGPLVLKPTPPDVGMRIELHLGDESGTAIVSRIVMVPDLERVDWAYLDEFGADAPADPSPTEGFGLGAFGIEPFGL